MLRNTHKTALLPLLLLVLLLSSCTRLHVDPNAGAETVYLRTLDHADNFAVEYTRSAAEGPLVREQNAWTLFWFVPVNQPDLGIWLKSAMPEGTEAANVRASVKTPWYGYPLFFLSLTMAHAERVRFEADPVKVTMIPPSDRIPNPPNPSEISPPRDSATP